MSYQSILLKKEEGIATIRFNRPEKLNALTFQTYQEVAQACEELRHDAETRVVVITGEGRGFCSGGDVSEIVGTLLERGTSDVLEFTRLTGRATRSIVSLGKPAIASVNGIAAGAGAVIASACDIRIAAQSARFSYLFVRIGLTGADMGVAFLLPRLVGLGKAFELLYTGDIIDAQEALRIGLVNKVVPDAELESASMELARRLAKGPPIALRVTKDIMLRELATDLEAAIELDTQAQAMCLRTEDHREGYRAFLEKREPLFRGK